MKVALCLMCFFSTFAMLNAQVESNDKNSNERSEASYYHVKGSHAFNLGVGFPNLANSAFRASRWAGYEGQGKASPNFTFKYEYGLSPVVGIGAHVGYYTAKTPVLVSDILEGDILEVIGGIGCDLGLPIPGIKCDTIFADEDGESAYDRINATTLGVRLAYRKASFFGIEKLDAYGTVLLGYSVIKTKRVGDESGNVKKSSLPTFVYNTSAGLRYYLSPNIGVYGEVGYGSLTILNLGLTYRILPEKIE